MAFIRLDYKSAALMRGVSVSVFLPSDSMMGETLPPYKTLYLLPGYSANASEIYTYLGIRAQSELKGIAVVIPNGENLFYQDLPQRQTFYSTYVGKELVEETRKLLPLSTRREDTFIGGISMGGYGALYNGLKYRDTFSKIMAMSPAADPYHLMVEAKAPGFTQEQFHHLFGSREELEKSDCNLHKVLREADKATLPEIFLCCGTNDRLVYEPVQKLEETLKAEGVGHVFRESAGDHEIYYWECMMDEGFSFLAGIPAGTRDKLVIPDFL